MTEELIPGYKFSRCSYLAGLLRPIIYNELELKKYGVKFYMRDPNAFTPLLDGRYLLLGSNEADNQREISKFSAMDAAKYAEYEQMIAKFARFADAVFLDDEPFFFSELPAGAKGLTRVQHLNQLQLMLRFVKAVKRLGMKDLGGFLELVVSPATKILNRWFESEPLLATLATDSVVGANVSPYTLGSGYVLLHHVMGSVEGRSGAWAYVEGGMGAISNALARRAVEKGAKIELNATVKSINMRLGKVTGVTLTDGRQFDSNVVMSNCTPLTTYGLCEHDNVLKSRKKIDSIDYTSPVFKINVALKGLPNFMAYPNTPDGKPGPQHFGTIHLASESMRQLDQAFHSAQDLGDGTSWSRRPMVEMTIPSALDPTLAPPGHHVAGLFVQYAPTNRELWRDPAKKEQFADLVFDVIEEYAPGFKDLVIYRDLLSPLDLEETFGLTGGSISHGAMGLDQLWVMRPFLGRADYTSDIVGLYLCGAGTHPGGGVMGAGGRNATMRVLRDNLF